MADARVVGLGPLVGSDAKAAVLPRIPALCLAGLGALWKRHPRRLGLPRGRSGLLALDLGAPQTIVSETPGYDIKTQGDAYPKGEKITFEFPAKDGAPGIPGRGPITLHWYSGTVRIPRPADLEPGRQAVDTGAVVLGDKGTIMYGSHGAGGVRIIPEAKMRAYKLPPKTIARAKEHHQDWLDAIRAGRKAGSDFAAYGAPLTEIGMLGVIASRFAGTKLQWDTRRHEVHQQSRSHRLAHAGFPARVGSVVAFRGRIGSRALRKFRVRASVAASVEGAAVVMKNPRKAIIYSRNKNTPGLKPLCRKRQAVAGNARNCYNSGFFVSIQPLA